MDIDSMKCRNCGGTSLSPKNSDIMVCDYCGAEYDLAQLRAKAAALEKEQKAIDALAGDLSRLRQLADQKEAERQKAIDEEKRKKKSCARSSCA
ncbi:hypothetical protein IJT93_03405 [bacterium]|nr:hypothetical protein [bacterium]